MSRPRFPLTVTLALVLLVLLPSHTDAARILGFFPAPSKSHLLIHCAVADALSQAGHDVTVVASMPNVLKNTTYKFIEIDAPTFSDTFASNIISNPKPVYIGFLKIMQLTATMANQTLGLDIVQKFLHKNGPGSFDLIVMGYFNNDFHLGLAAHFQCPIVLSFMVQPFFSVSALVANPAEAAYVPMLFSGLSQPMSFSQRLKNMLAHTFEQTYMQRILDKLNQKFYDIHFPSDRYPSLEEMKKNVSLVLVNHHFSQGPIRPQVPGIVEIGGIQIKEKPHPLPKDIAEVLDNAKGGAIYFSLGSNVQGSILSKEKAKLMFDVLSKLPYTVLWKWGDSGFPGTSKNIIYKSWLPQDDILAHPNVKLFITHGGQGSVVESQYHGVPMVGIPLFGDQPANMLTVEKNGFGLSQSYIDMTEQSFRDTILEVLTNPKYSEAVKRFSRIYRDRPMTARETAVFWVEYVLRHHGAKHLQSPAVFMNHWQLMSLDVIAFLLAIVAVVLFIFIKLCKFICCRGKTAKKTHDKATHAKKNK